MLNAGGFQQKADSKIHKVTKSPNTREHRQYRQQGKYKEAENLSKR